MDGVQVVEQLLELNKSTGFINPQVHWAADLLEFNKSTNGINEQVHSAGTLEDEQEDEQVIEPLLEVNPNPGHRG